MDIFHNNAWPRTAQHFPPLSLEAHPAVPTEQAAYYLHRKPQTLRKWAVHDGTGPVRDHCVATGAYSGRWTRSVPP